MPISNFAKSWHTLGIDVPLNHPQAARSPGLWVTWNFHLLPAPGEERQTNRQAVYKINIAENNPENLMCSVLSTFPLNSIGETKTHPYHKEIHSLPSKKFNNILLSQWRALRLFWSPNKYVVNFDSRHDQICDVSVNCTLTLLGGIKLSSLRWCLQNEQQFSELQFYSVRRPRTSHSPCNSPFAFEFHWRSPSGGQFKTTLALFFSLLFIAHRSTNI